MRENGPAPQKTVVALDGPDVEVAVHTFHRMKMKGLLGSLLRRPSSTASPPLTSPDCDAGRAGCSVRSRRNSAKRAQCS